MKPKPPTFTLSGSTITETKTGYTGTIKKNTAGYDVELLSGPTEEPKRQSLRKRMRNWYVHCPQ